MRSHLLCRSVVRGAGVVCAAVFVTNADVARAGTNVWTSQGPMSGLVDALAIDPGTPDTLYAARNGAGVFKSTDAGNTWTPANAGLPDSGVFGGVAALAIDPLTPSTLYAGTFGGGVFDIEQIEATPTPTPTATATPTHTPPATPVVGFSGDGCTVTPRHEGYPSTCVLVLLGLVLSRARRHRRLPSRRALAQAR